MNKILGIDLGTTNSCAALIEDGKPVVIPTSLGSRITQSVVRFLPNGETIVGEHAYRTRLVDPMNTVTGIKRFIGRRYNEVFDIAQTVPFKVVIGKNNLAMIEAQGNRYSPQIISAMILRSLKSSAEHYVGQSVSSAVITVPAYFNDSQRQATREAAKMAGLEVMRIINEPTAAAMAYGLGKKRDEFIAVFDLGGGTLDVSILEVGEGVIEVKSISGDNFLGGDDFDNCVISWIVEEFELDCGVDLSRDPSAMQLVREAAVKAKCELSAMEQTSVEISFVPFEDELIKGPSLLLTRNKFEEICDELFERLIIPCKIAAKNAGVNPSNIDKIILVGGATRMPRVSDKVKGVFGKEPSKSINPDEAVALGAAVQAGIMAGDRTDMLLLDVTSMPIGIECENGTTQVLIHANTTIPTRKSEIFSTAVNNQKSVEIHVLEGSRHLTIDNRSLGRFILDGITRGPHGTPQIEVSVDIDANGITLVSAKDMSTGKESRITLQAATGLSDDDRAKRVSDVREI